mgnify:CR=1 FL=1
MTVAPVMAPFGPVNAVMSAAAVNEAALMASLNVRRTLVTDVVLFASAAVTYGPVVSAGGGVPVVRAL